MTSMDAHLYRCKMHKGLQLKYILCTQEHEGKEARAANNTERFNKSQDIGYSNLGMEWPIPFTSPGNQAEAN